MSNVDLDRRAIEACNAAGWLSMGVGNGDGQLFVYGPSEAILSLQQKLVAKGSIPQEEDWERYAREDMDLQILRPSAHHVQFRMDGKVLADWWPSKGTTMINGQRGPLCETGEEVLAWLKTL